MKKSFKKYEKAGLPGGPNEKVFSREGYRSTSPDVNNPFNIIPSGNITMKEKNGAPLKKGPLLGIDNLGNSKLMLPGANYQFPGDVVKEVPLAKKGGPFQNSNIYATNKLFAKNPLFKKRKKGKKARGIYNPKAKYTYDDGGETNCPLGFIWNGIECIPNPFETRPSQRAAVYMDKDGTYKMDPVYQQFSQQKFDVAESNKKAQDFNKMYAQSKNYKRLLKKQGYTPEEIEDRINSIMNINDIRYTDEGPSWVGTNEDTGNEFISYNVTDPGDWPGFDQIAAHEWGHVGVDSGANPLKQREREEFINRINKEQAGVTGNPDDLVHDMEPQENRADLLQLRQQLQEAGVFDSTKRKRFTKKDLKKYKDAMKSSERNWDNMWNRMFRLYDDDSIIYFMNNVAKNNSNEDLQVAKYGFELDLTEDEIQKYVKGGYVVEDISVPSLTRMDNGGTNTCPPDHYWNGEACVPTGRTFTPIDPNYVAQHPDEARFIQNEAEVSVSRPASDIAKFRDEWKRNNPRDQWLDEKKRYYLNTLSNKALDKIAGVSMSNFPADVRQNYLDEYEYLANTYAIDKIGDKRGFNPKRRGDWVDQLSEGEKNAMAQSKYSSKVQPSYWARGLAGLQEFGNFLVKQLPGEQGDVFQYNIPGLTKKEQKEIAESRFGALEMLSPIDLPGAAIANYLNNRGLSTGSDYKELPGIVSAEKMANVSDLEATLLNPITYFGLESLPELGINLVKGVGRGTGSLIRGGKQLISGSEAIPATEGLVKGLTETHPTGALTEVHPTSIDELSNSGFRNDPNYHAERFNQKKQQIVEALKTPEGKKRLQGYIDNNIYFTVKTPEMVITELEATPFVTKRKYFRDRNNPSAFFKKQIDELIAKGELDPNVREQYDSYVVGKDGTPYTNFDVDPNNAYNWYVDGLGLGFSPDLKPTPVTSTVSMGQNFTPYDAQHILEHEFQHFFQRGMPSEADNILKDIELIDDVSLNQPSFVEFVNRYNPFKRKHKDVGYSVTGDVYKTDLKNPNRKEGLLNQKTYWNIGSRGQEKAAFAAEIRENMLQRGIIKNRYDEITPEMVKEHYNIYKNTTGNKYNLRAYDIMKDKKKNFEILSKALNKLPVIAPIGVGVGAAAAAGANDGANYKSGGLIEKKSSLLKADDGIEISDNSLFNDKLQEIADELGVTVDDLVGIMQHESRLNPSAVNPYTGAVGLIQFMPNTAKGLGTSIDALKNMSAIEQLDYVEKFYKPVAGKAKDIGDLYMYTFLPAAVGKPDDFVIGVKDSDSSIFGINQDALYKQNAVFDSEKKGYYTVGDVKKRISNFTGKPLTAPNRKKTTKRIPGKVEDTVKVIKRKHYAEPNKKEEAIPVDPRIEQLAAFSKIMAPTSENIFQLYNQGMSTQMKYGGLTRMDNGGPIQGIEGLKEDFADRLSQFIQDAESQGINLRIGSGYRSYEKQKQLWEAALKKYGSAEVARKWVAPPGSSYHNKGLAVDLHDQNSRALGKEENEEATAWAHANAKKYDLHFRLGNEPWHIEPIEFTGEDHEHTDENDVTGDILIPDLQTESKVEYDDDYSDWSPNKKEVVASDPRLEQLKAFSEIIAPSSQNINMMYQNAIKGNMKKGGFILEIDDRDIQKYLDGGFIVEEID